MSMHIQTREVQGGITDAMAVDAGAGECFQRDCLPDQDPTRNGPDFDVVTRSELCDEDLPAAPSVLEILLSASSFPNTRPKRSASCPPKFSEVSLEDLAAQLGDMAIVLPYSDPTDLPLDIKQQADEQNKNAITVENAQTLLDPEACLFIAK